MSRRERFRAVYEEYGKPAVDKILDALGRSADETTVRKVLRQQGTKPIRGLSDNPASRAIAQAATPPTPREKPLAALPARRRQEAPAVPPERGRTAYGTYELAPGMMTRHRPDVLADEALRNRFSVDPATSWRTGEGTDLLYDIMGMQQSPTTRMTGIYTPDVPGAAMESNIGFAARPRLRVDDFGNPLPEDMAAMNAAEAVRAVADTQGAGAWSMPTRPTNPEAAGALFTPTGGATDIDRLLSLGEMGGRYGLPDVADLGEGVLMTSFEGLPSGAATRAAMTRPAALGQSNLTMDVRDILGPSARPERVGTAGGYIGLEDAWMQPEGSGAVSRELRGYLDALPPAQREALLEEPSLAQAFGQRFLRDEEARMSGIPVRDDVQRAREAIAEQERLQELFELIRRGVPTMARGGLAYVS